MFAFDIQREATFKDGCLAVRKEVIDNQKARTAPGPIYNPKPRILSTEKSLRDITFGTAPARYNDRVSKLKHPGPQSYNPEAIRKAPQSNKHQPASFSFGTGKRACNSIETSKSKLPSPAEYDPENIRKGIRFCKKGTSSVRFGTAQLNCNKKGKDLPGPQSYAPEKIKRGIMFTKKGMPSVKFGDPPKQNKTSNRSSIINKQPGPQEYDTENIRKAVFSLSTKKRPVGVKFTTGPRTYNDAEERERSSKPGPNSYKVPSALGKQVNSRYKSQPCISFGAR